MAEISGGEYFLPLNVHAGVAVVAADHFVGHHLHFFADFVVAAPHEPLDGENRVLGVGDGLAFGHLAHQPLAALGERHDRRRGAGAFLIRDDRGLAGFHHGDAGIGRAQVDADNFSHCLKASLSYCEIE